jgi:hypothetical protein
MSNSNKNSNKKSNKSKNDSSKPLSLKDLFNLEFVCYLLLVSIPVTLFFNTVFNHSSLGDMASLFIVTSLVTGLVLYHMLKDKTQSIEMLSDKSAIIFVVFIAFVSLFLLFRRMFQEKVYTLNGAMYFSIIILILVIVYNFVQILLGIS